MSEQAQGGSGGNSAAGAAPDDVLSGGSGSGGSASNGGGAAAPRWTGVTVDMERVSVQEPYSSGGMAYIDPCPLDQVLVGFEGYVGDGLSDPFTEVGELVAVQGVCATLAFDSADVTKIILTRAEALPNRQSTSSTTGSTMCPPNQVVIGFTTWEGALNQATLMWIRGIALECAPLSIEGDWPEYGVAIGPSTTADVLGLTSDASLGTKTCPTDQVATAQDLRAGLAIDTFGVGCSTLQVVSR